MDRRVKEDREVYSSKFSNPDCCDICQQVRFLLQTSFHLKSKQITELLLLTGLLDLSEIFLSNWLEN